MTEFGQQKKKSRYLPCAGNGMGSCYRLGETGCTRLHQGDLTADRFEPIGDLFASGIAQLAFDLLHGCDKFFAEFGAIVFEQLGESRLIGCGDHFVQEPHLFRHLLP